jgi:hypothetical protein
VRVAVADVGIGIGIGVGIGASAGVPGSCLPHPETGFPANAAASPTTRGKL